MRDRFRFFSGIAEDVGLALLVVGVIAVIGGALIYGIIEELRSWSLALIGAGVLALLIGGFFSRAQVARIIATRQGRYGVNTIVMIIAFTAILGLTNIVSTAVNSRVDLTANRGFTLATQTQQVLEDLREPVEVFGFFTPEDVARPAADGLLREYSLRSNNFSYEIVDPETDPAKANRFDVDQNGIVVFSSRDRVARTTDLTEQAFTTSLLQATGTQLKTVCFTSGHGELSVLGTTDIGMSLARAALERELYIVRDFGFSSAGRVPEECSAVIVAGPTRDLTAEEDSVDEGVLLRNYLGSGGNILFLLTKDTPVTWLTLLYEAGIGAGGGAIVDPGSFAQPDVTTPTIRPEGYLPNHPITGPLIDRSLVTFFPLVTRVAPLPPGLAFPGTEVYPLAFTTDRSWLEKDIENLSSPRYDAEVDLRGPLAIASAVEFPAANDTGRIVAIGNASFASNQFVNSAGNIDLFMNSANWLTEQEALIGIRARLNAPRLLVLTQREASWIFYSGVGVFPALMLLVGGWTWWRRR